MTEAEYLASDDPAAMLVICDQFPISDRKLILVSCAFYRAICFDLTPWTIECLPFWEKYADGEASQWEISNYNCRRVDLPGACRRAVEVAGRLPQEQQRGRKRLFAGVLRDIAGNPFHPHRISRSGRLTADVLLAQRSVTGCCNRHADNQACDCIGQSGTVLLEWITPTVKGLAEAAYDERGEDGMLDAERLMVLADALEEAGCSNLLLLTHLRSAGPHVRGCAVADCILEKE